LGLIFKIRLRFNGDAGLKKTGNSFFSRKKPIRPRGKFAIRRVGCG